MKKSTLILMVALILLLVSGCGTTTITEHEGNYIYTQNEDINIIEIDTRNHIGTLKMTQTEVLMNNPFTIKEKSGTDENGNDIYEDVTYQQLVQVFFLYDSKGSGKSVSSLNFSAYDSADALCETDPDIEYNVVKRDGEKYFVIALKNKSDSVNLNFNYNLMQMSNTAKIKLPIAENPDNISSQSESEDSNSAPSSKNPDNTSSQSENEDLNSTPSSKNSDNTSNEHSSNEKKGINPMGLYIIIGVLGLVIVVLSIIVIVQFQHKNKRY